jgi:hypothetical protein
MLTSDIKEQIEVRLARQLMDTNWPPNMDNQLTVLRNMYRTEMDIIHHGERLENPSYHERQVHLTAVMTAVQIERMINELYKLRIRV